MKNILIVACVLAMVGCAKTYECEEYFGESQTGVISMKVRFEDTHTRGESALTDYTEALEDEKKINRLCFCVFDKKTGVLNTICELTDDFDNCSMRLPVGEKVIYALVNGPYPDGVRTISDMDTMMDVFSSSGWRNVGLTLMGMAECVVNPGDENEVETIPVRWLVSRVVLSGVTCNIPKQHGGMTVDCVFLGNANTRQYFYGEVDGMVNVDGLASDYSPIGKGGVTGSFGSYLYRKVGKTVECDETHSEKYYMYCQPNSGNKHTCLYLLATIGGCQYYYRVPLTNGLKANTTCTVDLKVTNLGSPEPPTGDMQKGDIKALISFEDWIPGNRYVEEF